jgi:anti-sigma B factor antagonist
MQITERRVAAVTILDTVGRITLRNGFETLQQAIQRAVRAGQGNVLLNLAETDYVDGSIIGQMVLHQTNLQKIDGDLRLLSLQPRVAELLKLTHLEDRFKVFKEEKAALDSFAASSGA